MSSPEPPREPAEDVPGDDLYARTLDAYRRRLANAVARPLEAPVDEVAPALEPEERW